jgi:hypothetical protein
LVSGARVADYYAELQVHPNADQEVIEAAYRQLMKKYHPDKAGGDPRRSVLYHHRAKAINAAFSVLRDPVQRHLYDAAVLISGADRRPPSRPPQSEATEPPAQSSAEARAPPAWVEIEESALLTTLRQPLEALSALYYLLPGPYEWEPGHGQELLTAGLLPPLVVASFALATGRLAPWVGRSPNALIAAWAVLLLLALPTWRWLPRVAVAAVPSVLLLSGSLDAALRQASVPTWLAWLVLGCLGMVLSARLYLFAILPALGACWLVARIA